MNRQAADLEFAIATVSETAGLLTSLAGNLERIVGLISSPSVNNGQRDLAGERPVMEPPPMSIPETAARLGCTRQTVGKMLDVGALPTVMVGKRRRVPVSAVESHLRGSSRD